jgi:ribosomal protein S18 acetylase RimI-like enzyme
MSAPPAGVLRWGAEQARTGRWRGDGTVAFLTPLPTGPPPSPEFLSRCLQTLAARGYTRVVTGALSPSEQGGFLAAGFSVEEKLHLLALELGPGLPPVPPGLPLRRPRRGDHDAVLAVDNSAFSPFWRFDRTSLADALTATPRTRFRVAVDGEEVVGYAICGRAGTRGFVQRLAVAPAHQGRGAGRRLLFDGLCWLSRRGARRAVVNTQIGNQRALALYLDCGFCQDPSGLSVLSAGLS